MMTLLLLVVVVVVVVVVVDAVAKNCWRMDRSSHLANAPSSNTTRNTARTIRLAGRTRCASIVQSGVSARSWVSMVECGLVEYLPLSGALSAPGAQPSHTTH